MNIKELKEAIANLPDDMQVILQRDSEGNGYSPLCSLDSDAIYTPTNSWSGDVYYMEHGLNIDCKSKPNALILAPIN